MLTSVPADSGWLTAPPTGKGYRQYHSDPKLCRTCPLRPQCTRSRNLTKLVTRHVWQATRERIDGHRLQERGKRIYERRKERVERSFADAKQLHGHRYARMRGLAKVREQCLLAAAAQSLKKIARLLSHMRPETPPAQRLWLLQQLLYQLASARVLKTC